MRPFHEGHQRVSVGEEEVSGRWSYGVREEVGPIRPRGRESLSTLLKVTEDTMHRFIDTSTEAASIKVKYHSVLLLHSERIGIVRACLSQGSTVLPLREHGRTMFHTIIGGHGYLMTTFFYLGLPMATVPNEIMLLRFSDLIDWRSG